MGIMGKKVTRRVALGTAFGGLAAAPFVLRAMRRRYHAILPANRFASEWEQYVKMLDVPIADCDGPSRFTLDFRPPVGARFNAMWLEGTYFGRTELAEYPQAPVGYDFSQGYVAVQEPFEGTVASLLLHLDRRVEVSCLRREEKPGAECVVVPGEGATLEFFQAGRASPKRLPVEEVCPPCHTLGCATTFDYPKGDPLGIGAKWTIPESSVYCTDLPCEAVGFARVGGFTTVKIVAERHLHGQDLQACIVRTMRSAPLPKGRGAGDLDAAIKTAVKRATEQDMTLTIRVVRYIDIKTGIAARLQFLMKTRRGNREAPTDSMVISQLV
ncbi:MAG: hypothetical protein ACLQNE_38070 [Thermoguttaceae bacterium]